MINKPQLAVPDFLLEIARQIFSENELPEKARCETAVKLRRRFRGATRSDLLGNFNPLVPNYWLGDGPEQELIMNMYGFHVVKPVIRANQSAMVQAEVECDISATSRNPNTAGVASIARGVYRFINGHPDYWSNSLKNQISQQCHTDPGYFIRTYFDPNAESPITIKLDEYSDTPVEQPGEYACAYCGAGGPMFSDDMRLADNGTMQCLNSECNQQAEILAMPEMAEVNQFKCTKEYPAGNVVQEVVSAFQVRIDERKTKNGELRRADWLDHHFLIDEDDLQAMAPYFDIGSPSEWSYPLKWEYALETGTEFRLKPWTGTALGHRRPLHEVRRIYLRPNKYRNYVAPTDFVLDRGDGRIATNRQGQPMLQIRAGQRLIDLFPTGFWFVVSSDRLLPVIEPCDLREEWTYGGFLNDSASFWYQPAVELEELQRAANNLYTIEMQHLETSSIVTTFFDRDWFDEGDFERGLSPTKEGTHISVQDDISRHMKSVVPPQLSSVMQGMEFIRSLVPDVSGVQPAAIGAPSPSEPFAAQRLQRQQSLGLLTPAQQSMAACKARVVMQHLKLAQRTKPYEWFEYIGTRYGEEWKRNDIDAFLKSNLELDLVVDYKKGTEIPTTVIEQEMKYRQYLLDTAQVAQFVPGIVKPEMVTEMLSKYGSSAGLDLDFGNVEADQRLADSRYQKIKSWICANKNQGMPEELMIELALADRSLKVTPGEDHETHVEFYEDHIRALMAVEDPDYALIGCCLKMIARHQEGETDQAQTKSAQDVEGAAPEIAAQVAAQQAQVQAEQQKEAAALQAEAAAKAQDNESALERQAMVLNAKAEEGNKKREHDAQQKAADRVLKDREIVAKASTSEGTAETPVDPIQSIAESMDYPDLPTAAQSEMLSRVGLPTAGVKDVHQATLERAQIAAAKARANRPSNGAGK